MVTLLILFGSGCGDKDANAVPPDPDLDCIERVEQECLWYYEPQEDITVYELAQLVPVLICDLSDCDGFIFLDKPKVDEELLRHFRKECSDKVYLDCN